MTGIETKGLKSIERTNPSNGLSEVSSHDDGIGPAAPVMSLIRFFSVSLTYLLAS